eukprot:TRINITY_DN20190_c0_g1_i1.p1 TRINITY_DN20190_c0_g1~~TRINITY_DN20190_c0_g1_i1.p1  ORF type:complete len:325 (+),score=81.90 TRINITY_DN20190_c0_g1_i1:85-1059(+)
MSEEWEQELKEAEDNLNTHVKELGKLKTEYDHNLNKLTESYYPKMRPLKVQVYHSLQVRRFLEKEIEWLEIVFEKCKKIGDGVFREEKDLARERAEMIATTAPIFDKSIESLTTLKKEDLLVMRKYEHPPQLILETMDAVMTLRGEDHGGSAEKAWEEAKYLLCDTYFFAFFVSKAKNFDRSLLTDEILDKLSKFTSSPDFEPKVVIEASVPCSAICEWIRALYEIAKVNRITDVKSRTQTEIEADLAAAKEKLHIKTRETAGAEQKLIALQQEFEQRRYDLKDRYDHTMNPLQERFLEAHHHYGETFCSPRRQRLATSIETAS